MFLGEVLIDVKLQNGIQVFYGIFVNMSLSSR